MEEVTLRTERLLDGIVFDVDRLDVRLPDGLDSKRDLVRHRGGVGVLARTPRGTYLFVRQFRKAVEQEVLEIVAGMREPGEDPETTGRRELEEETGYRAVSMSFLGKIFASPGYTDEVVHLYLAETEEAPAARRLDHDERVCVEELEGEEIARKIREGEMMDGKSVAAWFWAGQRCST